jgi:phosphatidylinositol alpha-mannosyltransferase
VKIGLVSPYDWAVPGGVNSHIAHLAKQFIEWGHTVKIVAPTSSLEDGFLLDHLIPIGRPVPVPTAGAVARIAISPVGMAAMVKQVLESEQFDIVHIHEPLQPLLSVYFLRFSHAVNVGTYHAAKDGGSKWYSYSRPLIRRLSRRLHGRIAVSQPARRFVDRYVPADYVVIPNGIDIDHFSTPRPPLPQYDDGKLNILFVGRPEKRKGLKYLLRAFTRVKMEIPNTRLIVVGAGRFDRYERAVGSLVNDICFHSYVSYEELPRFHQSAHVFCSPATGNESQGIALLEAMAAGLPVVASNIDGFASVVTHGIEAILVPRKDAEAIADGLLFLLRNPELRAAMGQRARQRAADFRWERVAQQVLSYYERLLYEQGHAQSLSLRPVATKS